MPYIEAVTKAGCTIEIERYYTSRYNRKGEKRKEKKQPTKEEQKKINSRQAEKKLRRLINANFNGNDYHVVLPYIRKKGEEGRTREDMRDDIAKFLRQLRKAYRAAGSELKYIHVMEIGEKGARHHHLILNHIDTKAITSAWTHARAQVFPLDDSGQYAQLASYLIKYTDAHIEDEDALQAKRWNASRNLTRPITKVKIITNRAFFKSEAVVPYRYRDKYVLDDKSVASGIYNNLEYSGYGFMRFTLLRKRD